MTRIPWADETWNPMTGCTPVSEACVHCYAERMAKRFNRQPCTSPCDGKQGTCFTPTFHQDRLDKPLHWRKPRRIFVCSMSDLFHEAFTDEQVGRVFRTICEAGKITTPAWGHTWLVLTKRPDRMLRWFDWARENEPGWFNSHGKLDLGNVVGMVTAENQARADERIPLLLQAPFRAYGVSVEPMLGPIELANLAHWNGCPEHYYNPLEGYVIDGDMCETERLDWVIVGGENGPGARPMQPEWALDVWRQCKAAGVAFFWKQEGSASAIPPHKPYTKMIATREFPEATHD